MTSPTVRWGTGRMVFLRIPHGRIVGPLVGPVVRKYFGLAVEPFRVIAGLSFVLGGVWELSGLQFGLVPIMLIVAGMALLFSALRMQGA